MPFGTYDEATDIIRKAMNDNPDVLGLQEWGEYFQRLIARAREAERLAFERAAELEALINVNEVK